MSPRHRQADWSFAAPHDDDDDVPRRSLMTGVTPEPIAAAPKPVRVWPCIAGLALDVQRERRRVGLDVEWDGRFDLVDEVRMFTQPLADAASEVFEVGRFTVPVPGTKYLFVDGGPSRQLVFFDEVERFATATHKARRGALTLLGRSGVSGEVRERLRAAAAVPEPEISDDDVQSGAWRDLLIAHVEPVAADLAELLGRSASPTAVVMSPASEELKSEVLHPLGETALYVDQRVRELLVQFRQGRRAQRVADQERAKRDRDSRAAEMARMGLQ